MPVLSPCMDIKSLIEQHAGIQVVGKPSYVHGVEEYHSNCPWCPGSHDGFITCPATGRYSHAIRAKGCNRNGDMIDFLKDYASMTSWEACEEIGIDPDELEFMRAQDVQSTLARKSTAPGKVWRDCADNELALAQARMRRPVGSIGLEFLRTRGFSDEIIQERNLGYLPLSNGKYLHQEPLEKWGLTYEEVGKEHVNVFEGVIIPWYVNHQIWKLEVRRITQADPDHRTPEISGSREPLYNCDAIQSGKPVVLCEGALDAISGIQACGSDLAVFVATGGTGKARVNTWIKRLSEASCVLVAFDDDESGEKGSDYWCDVLPNAIRCVPWAHDLNDMLRDRPDGEDIREWLADGIETYDLIEKAKKVPVKKIVVQPPPASSIPLQGNTPTAAPPLTKQRSTDDQVGRIVSQLSDQGITFLQSSGHVIFEGSFPYADPQKIQHFIAKNEVVLFDWIRNGRPGATTPQPRMSSYDAAQKFYQAFCAQSGYYLRMREDGQVGIGVPETLSDEKYAEIAQRVNALGDELEQVIRDAPASAGPQSEAARTCCKCSAPAEHFSPSGYGYCSGHYQCAGGHAPQWAKYDGSWMCQCDVDRMPAKSRLN